MREFKAGDLINEQYRVLHKIGQGGMNKIYLVEDINGEGNFAMKVTKDPAEIQMNAPEAYNKFLKEITILTTIRHPILPKIKDYLAFGDKYCIIEEFIESESLEEHIRNNLPSAVDVVRWSLVLCREYKNNEGVIHAIIFDQDREIAIAPLIQKDDEGSYIDGDSDVAKSLMKELGERLKLFEDRGLMQIIVCSPGLRPALRKLFPEYQPRVIVLSHDEIAPGVKVKDPTMHDEEEEKIDALSLDIRLEKWLASFIIDNNEEYDIRLDEAAEETLMKGIGKEFGKLDSSKEFKVILCSSSIYNVINGSVRGSLLKEMLEERFPNDMALV
ncbi:MAG: FHIPEP family type III secretion protein [Candidatus Xenobiia bacterium LiM19]